MYGDISITTQASDLNCFIDKHLFMKNQSPGNIQFNRQAVQLTLDELSPFEIDIHSPYEHVPLTEKRRMDIINNKD